MPLPAKPLCPGDREASVSSPKGQFGDVGGDALPPTCRLQAGTVVTLSHLSPCFSCPLCRAAREKRDQQEPQEKWA